MSAYPEKPMSSSNLMKLKIEGSCDIPPSKKEEIIITNYTLFIPFCICKNEGEENRRK